MHKKHNHIAYKEKWKNIRYSSVFSRRNFVKILNDDFVLLNDIIKDDESMLEHNLSTYKDCVTYIYDYLIRHYRNEYIIKNALLDALIKEYGTKQTIALNEFSVGESIADMVLFNGCSKAFEIKTEYDSPKRLATQILDYTEIFQFCYIVVPKDDLIRYEKGLNANVGILTYSLKRSHFHFEKIRDANENLNINPHLLMRCLRTGEYKKIVHSYYGFLPEMNAFTAYNVCEQLLCGIPSNELHKLFIKIIKERRNNMQHLKSYDQCLRQMCLSMHITPKEYDIINTRLLTHINL